MCCCQMAKQKSWFSFVKRFFIWETHATQEKKEKRRKWIFGRIKNKKLPSIAAAPPSIEKTEEEQSKNALKALSEAEEEQSKHALTVAIASAAAAEAAVTAAHAAAEVVRLTEISQSFHKPKENSEESQSIYQCQMKIQESAAIKIQTAFRGYLARKALRALKGIVKLQAIIRGRAVRRQAMSTLKCLQSIVSIHSQVCARRRLQMVEGKLHCTENEDMLDSKDKIIRMDSNSARKWDDSTLLKDELDAYCNSKKEAVVKRERIKDYSFNHRRSAETERSKVKGRWRYWLEQWVDTQLSKSKELEDLDSLFTSHYSKFGEEEDQQQQHVERRNTPHKFESFNNSPKLSSTKSFPHRRQSSIGLEENISTSNPSTPAYMAATESAKARARSTTSPKLRNNNLEMNNSESYSPCKKKLFISSSINSEVLNSGKVGKNLSYQQKSPSFKGISVPVRSTKSMKDLSINSDCSLPSWDRQSSFK